MDFDKITTGLQTEFIGRKVIAYQQIGSTNDVALRLGRSGAEEGTLVIAESQTAGRGRHGRRWFAPPNSSILASLILRPSIEKSKIAVINLLAAVAVAKAIRIVTSLPTMIKWPNDVLIYDKKVCGILTEVEAERENIQFLVVGMGINVNIPQDSFPVALKPKATSLSILLEDEVSRIKLLQQLLLEFEKRYTLLQDGDFTSIILEAKRLSILLGSFISVKSGRNIITGQALDIDESGALLLRRGMGGIEKIMAGDASLLSNNNYSRRKK